MHEDETKLREFYEMFTKKYCISDGEAEEPRFSGSFRKELEKEFPQEMEEYFYNKSGMSMSCESYFILNFLGIAGQSGVWRWCLEAEPFERISQESKDKMKRVFKAYSRSQDMFNTTQVSTTSPSQPTQSQYVKIYTDNNGNYVSFNPKNINSIMFCNDKTGKGECHYPNGWVNPVVNGQTTKVGSVNYGQTGCDKFKQLAQKAMILYQQQLNQQQNSAGNTYNQQHNGINFQNNNIFRSTQASMASPSKSTQSQYVKIYTDNNGNYISFNPNNVSSVMFCNDFTKAGQCYYQDGWVNPVVNGQTTTTGSSECGQDKFRQVKEYAMNLYQQQLNQQQNSVGNTYNQQQNGINFQNNNLIGSNMLYNNFSMGPSFK